MKKSFLKATRAAKNWTECYPIGNGNIGVMTTGGIKVDTMYLNDDRLWSGYGQKKWTDDKGKGLKEARELLLAGDKKGGEERLWKAVCGEFCEAYIPLGTLTFSHSFKRAKGYTRTLEMDKALLTVEAVVDGKEYKAVEYVSYPDKCYVKELQYAGKATTEIKYSSVVRYQTKVEDNVILGYGNAPTRVFPNYYKKEGGNIIYEEGNPGMDFVAATAVVTDGDVTAIADGIKVEGWSILRIVMVTSVSFREGDKLLETCTRAKALANISEVELKNKHLEDYCPLFNQVDLTINDIESSPENTEKAIKKYHKGKGDESIVVTEFDFGRYLLLAGSREGTEATNLQGIWNDKILSPWNCHHTVNINLEMNYWGAEKVGLHNCILPLLNHVEKAAKIGEKVAKDTFDMKGWCIHHNTDGWYNAGPIGGEDGLSNPTQYAYFPSGGGWLVSQLYESTLFVDDQDFKDRVLKLAKGASQFYLDYLVPYGDYLVPLLTTSPENAYLENGKHVYIDKWTTIAVSIIKNTFEAYLNLSDDKDDKAFKDAVKKAVEKLPPFMVGRDNRLLEYSEEYPEVEKKHRHVSHLYPVFPGDQITWNGTPNLMVAAKNVLGTRGLLGTGWSLSWKLNLCARFKDNVAAHTLLKNFNNLIKEEQIIYRGGGCYPSCLCAHPPFQIDGNYGFTSGVCEMLVQSHDGEIELAPCLAPSWKKVVVKGLKARGGKTVNYTYENGKIIEEV